MWHWLHFFLSCLWETISISQFNFTPCWGLVVMHRGSVLMSLGGLFLGKERFDKCAYFGGHFFLPKLIWDLLISAVIGASGTMKLNSANDREEDFQLYAMTDRQNGLYSVRREFPHLRRCNIWPITGDILVSARNCVNAVLEHTAQGKLHNLNHLLNLSHSVFAMKFFRIDVYHINTLCLSTNHPGKYNRTSGNL